MTSQESRVEAIFMAAVEKQSPTVLAVNRNQTRCPDGIFRQEKCNVRIVKFALICVAISLVQSFKTLHAGIINNGDRSDVALSQLGCGTIRE